MHTDWSTPLIYISIGMILGALALLLLSRIRKTAGRKRRAEPKSSPTEHAFEQLARPVSVPPRRAPPKYYHWMNLTEREKEVARLAAEGKTNAEIAQELVISPNTVSNHLSHIYGKLEINSRQQLTKVVEQIVDYDRDTPT